MTGETHYSELEEVWVAIENVFYLAVGDGPNTE
jgi:hypothetical protein